LGTESQRLVHLFERTFVATASFFGGEVRKERTWQRTSFGKLITNFSSQMFSTILILDGWFKNKDEMEWEPLSQT